ncbi:MAG: C39 family peptidase [Candidatus Peribacteraceae bacterium]|nr:C39 family peptidase [Candidatus Peribacteraceae bacterium]
MRRVIVCGFALLLWGCTGEPVPADPRQMEVLYRSPADSRASSAAGSGFLSSDRGIAPVTPSSSSMPSSVLIDVPFSPQAPFALWDALHEEACEEMSLLMVMHYILGEPLDRQGAEDRLQALIAWEQERDFPDDVTVEQLAAIARERFGLSASVRTDVTRESLEGILRTGKPVIVPAAGRDLGNPFFSGDGPWYHMLVIIGYDKDHFIVNDPGTRRGERYRYDKDILLTAIHDWTGVKETVREGRKAMLIIEP